MVDKKTADALSFLKAIKDFLSTSAQKERNDEALQYLHSEKGYVPDSAVEITSRLVADIINALKHDEEDANSCSAFEDHTRNITEHLLNFYRADTVVLNDSLLDKISEVDAEELMQEHDRETSVIVPVTAKDYYEKGAFHLKRKEYEDALTCFMQGLADGDEDEPLFICGILSALLNTHRDSEVPPWYERIMRLLDVEKNARLEFELHFQLGQIWSRRSQYAEALEQFSLAIGAIKKLFLRGRLIMGKDIVCVYMNQKYPIEILDLVDYIHRALEELRKLFDTPEIRQRKQKLVSEIKFIVLRMERIVSKGITGSGTKIEKKKNSISPEAFLAEVEEYKKDAAENPDDIFAYFNMAYIYGQLQMYKEQDACYDAILKTDPKNTDAWSEKGDIQGALGHYREAIKYFDRAIGIDPEYADGWYGKGAALSDMGRTRDAIRCFEEALRIDPEHVEAWHDKGLALGSLGKEREAIDCFEEALRLDPGCAEAWYSKGVVLGSCGKYQQEIECYDETLRIEPENTMALNSKGETLMNLSEYQAAEECFGKALKIDPAYAPAYYNRACLNARKSNREEALKNLRKAVELDSTLKKGAKKDKDFKSLRNDKSFKNLLK